MKEMNFDAREEPCWTILFGWASNFTVALGAKKKKRVAFRHEEQIAGRCQ
jgi:hypothetical protein